MDVNEFGGVANPRALTDLLLPWLESGSEGWSKIGLVVLWILNIRIQFVGFSVTRLLTLIMGLIEVGRVVVTVQTESIARSITSQALNTAHVITIDGKPRRIAAAV